MAHPATSAGGHFAGTPTRGRHARGGGTRGDTSGCRSGGITRFAPPVPAARSRRRDRRRADGDGRRAEGGPLPRASARGHFTGTPSRSLPAVAQVPRAMTSGCQKSAGSHCITRFARPDAGGPFRRGGARIHDGEGAGRDGRRADGRVRPAFRWRPCRLVVDERMALRAIAGGRIADDHECEIRSLRRLRTASVAPRRPRRAPPHPREVLSEKSGTRAHAAGRCHVRATGAGGVRLYREVPRPRVNARPFVILAPSLQASSGSCGSWYCRSRRQRRRGGGRGIRRGRCGACR